MYIVYRPVPVSVPLLVPSTVPVTVPVPVPLPVPVPIMVLLWPVTVIMLNCVDIDTTVIVNHDWDNDHGHD